MAFTLLSAVHMAWCTKGRHPFATTRPGATSCGAC